MANGILEVLLVDAKGLQRSDYIGRIDPYVQIEYKGQERKSSVAREGGRNPIWNETFRFKADYPGSGEGYKITFKIMDKDTFSRDDFLGETTIYVKDLLATGVENGSAEIELIKYRVVQPDKTYSGSIQVGVSYKVKDGR